MSIAYHFTAFSPLIADIILISCFRTQLTDKKSQDVDGYNPFEHREVAKPTS